MKLSAYKAGFIVYLSLMSLAFIFYKERTIFTDNAMHLFEIVRRQHFAYFDNLRFGAFFTQSFAVIPVRFSFSLANVQLLYSLGFIIYYGLMYFLCGQVFRQYSLAFALLLCNILFVGHAFFWMVSELPQGIAFMFTAFGALVFAARRMPPTLYGLLAFVLLTSIVLFFHPLMIVALGFSLVFFYLEDSLFSRKKLILFAAITVAVYIFKGLFLLGKVETASMSNIKRLLSSFPFYFDNYANRRFISNSGTVWFGIPLCLLVILVAYLRQRRFVLLSYVLLTSLGYLLFVNNCYPGRDIPDFYIENLYLPLSVFIVLPLVLHVIPLLSDRAQLIGLLLVGLVCTVRIFQTAEFYTSRLNWERKFLNRVHSDKLLVSSALTPSDTLLLTWATPYEFWLLSTVEKGETVSLVIHDSVNTLSWAAPVKSSFITAWGIFQYKDLPQRYFKFRDTATSYRVIENGEL